MRDNKLRTLWVDKLGLEVKLADPALKPVTLGLQGSAGASAQSARWNLTGQINAIQGRIADSVPFYDQHSLAIGTSYALTPNSKLKAEWLRTWVGEGSSMVDSPRGGPAVADESIDVFSFSYNFAY